MENKVLSYTAANSYPFKIYKNAGLVQELNRKHIPPFHAQLIPTNRCNLSCTFCSCKKRNKDQELHFLDLRQLARDLQELGCASVTITGGGEPLLHPFIVDILRCYSHYDIKIGLVTNGLLLDKLDIEALSYIQWCRISCADGRTFTQNTQDIIMRAVNAGPNVDWAFSYVVSDHTGFDPDNLAAYVRFANEQGFTHVRVVSDLINIVNSVSMDQVRKELQDRGVDDSLVIYQGRKDFDPGQKRCLISLLKPVIGADGFLYPCCGVQYARGNGDLDLAEDMRMAHIADIKAFYGRQKPFDGSVCTRCYYRNYNVFLEAAMGSFQHKEFA